MYLFYSKIILSHCILIRYVIIHTYRSCTSFHLFHFFYYMRIHEITQSGWKTSAAGLFGFYHFSWAVFDVCNLLTWLTKYWTHICSLCRNIRFDLRCVESTLTTAIELLGALTIYHAIHSVVRASVCPSVHPFIHSYLTSSYYITWFYVVFIYRFLFLF